MILDVISHSGSLSSSQLLFSSPLTLVFTFCFFLQFQFNSHLSLSHSVCVCAFFSLISLVSDWLGEMHVHFKNRTSIPILQERKMNRKFDRETDWDAERVRGKMEREGGGRCGKDVGVSETMLCIQRVNNAAWRVQLLINRAAGQHLRHTFAQTVSTDTSTTKISAACFWKSKACDWSRQDTKGANSS